jgi:hypothetical protein
MKNKIICFILLLIIFPIRPICAQSKRKKIQILTNENESLNSLLKSNKQLLDSLNRSCQAKMKLIDTYSDQIDVLKNTIAENNEKCKKSNEKLVLLNQQQKLQYLKSLDSISKINNTTINAFESTDFKYGNIEFTFTENDKYSDENLNGEFVSYYSKEVHDSYSKDKKKLVFAKGIFKNGYKQDVWTYYACDGTKEYEGNYNKGVKIGKWTNYTFCNDKISDKEFSYFDELNIIIDFYELDFELKKEVIYYNDGFPSDTTYYYDESNHLKLKVAWKEGKIFYNNNQPFASQKCKFEDPVLEGLENKNLEIYYPNGKIRYSLIRREGQIIEKHLNLNGKITSEYNYKNGSGKGIWYDENGKIIDETEYDWPEGKFGQECPCQ